jgi:hypothetical protein
MMAVVMTVCHLACIWRVEYNSVEGVMVEMVVDLCHVVTCVTVTFRVDVVTMYLPVVFKSDFTSAGIENVAGQPSLDDVPNLRDFKRPWRQVYGVAVSVFATDFNTSHFLDVTHRLVPLRL